MLVLALFDLGYAALSSSVALHLTSESIENADLPSLFALATIEPYRDLTISGKAPFELTTACWAGSEREGADRGAAREEGGEIQKGLKNLFK